jgi:hypothetical protein
VSRTIQDPNLLLWEVYATAGRSGFPDHARMVFQCLSDPGRRARFLEREGDKSDVENEVATLPPDRLLEMLDTASELN